MLFRSISVSSERIFQAIAIIEYAKQIGADAVAHGSTGAGNDQVRFDLTFQILAPEIEIITPTRDMTLTREYEIDYLRKHGITADYKKMEYSINKGLWGTSIGGKETLHSEQTLPEEAYPSQITAEGEERLKLICQFFFRFRTHQPSSNARILRSILQVNNRSVINRSNLQCCM